MFGYRDKRVTVRFTEIEFEKYEKLLKRLPAVGCFSVQSWTRLIHHALRELYNQYDIPQDAEKPKPSAAVRQRSPSDAKKRKRPTSTRR